MCLDYSTIIFLHQQSKLDVTEKALLKFKKKEPNYESGKEGKKISFICVLT